MLIRIWSSVDIWILSHLVLKCFINDELSKKANNYVFIFICVFCFFSITERLDFNQFVRLGAQVK